MIEVRRTREFDRWIGHLRDRLAIRRINERLNRVAAGNLGDVRPVGDGVSELRIDHVPGYRLYCTRRGAALVILLCGGDKSTQDRDIVRAKSLSTSLRGEP